MGPQDGVDIVIRAADVVVHELGRRTSASPSSAPATASTSWWRCAMSSALRGYVEFTGRAPDELVGRILSTADVGLSPDPQEPAQRPFHHEQVHGVHGLRAPVVAFDLRETRVSAGRRGRLRRAERMSRLRRVDRRTLDDEPRRHEARALRAAPGWSRNWPGVTRRRAI